MKAMIYRKKPVEVLALQWTGDNFKDIQDFAGDNVFLEEGELVIRTLEDGKIGKAKHVASINDFIIKGVKGEFYFCKPDIFKKTYDKIGFHISHSKAEQELNLENNLSELGIL